MADNPDDCVLDSCLKRKCVPNIRDNACKRITYDSETSDGDISEDDSVEDKDYVPDQDSSSGDDDEGGVTVSTTSDHTTPSRDEVQTTNEQTNSPEKNGQRKRQRKTESWKANKRKALRNLGQEYTSVTGRLVPAKVIQPFQHTCRYECNKFTEERRKAIHEEYWKCGSWQLQTCFIVKCVSSSKPRRPKKSCKKSKRLSTTIYLDEKRVCKAFFLKTLTISNRRFTTAALNPQVLEGLSPTDKRGKHAPGNKIPEDRLNTIHNHIRSFPTYTSHYSRHSNPKRKYLPPELSVSKMYALYVEKCKEENIVPLKACIYRREFNSKFNLSFYKLRSDTCNTCDRLENLIKAEADVCEKRKLILEKELHLRKVEQARAAKKTDVQKSEEKGVHVITFDLEKTLPTPMLTTNVIYYKRQLWTFNLGIHDCNTDHAFMYMWSENIASRGSSEIGSCLLKYVKSLPSETRHLIAYSDSCGGQNRNQIIARFWLYIVAHTSIETVDHKFLVPGHSYLENDADFSHIERKKKKTQYIFVPEDWMRLVENARPNFHVHAMQCDEFVSTEPIGDLLTNRKVDTEKQKIRWLAFRWMQYRKTDPKAFFFKETLNEDIDFRKVNLARPCRPGKIPVNLPPLRHAPVQLKKAKIDDLLSILQFIPPMHHNFYKTLTAIESTTEHQPRQRGRPRGRKTSRGTSLRQTNEERKDSLPSSDDEWYPETYEELCESESL